MNLFNRLSVVVVSGLLVLLLSSWGYRGHNKISSSAPLCFPSSISFLQGSFSTILVDSALAPDNRKDWDDTEAPKHFIDIDNYPEFQYYGRIPMSWDSLTTLHNMSFILDNGIVPWATITTYDSLRSCFARQDMVKAALFAADLGHYVGDAHNPLHVTANFDGQLTGQDGIHSRYETRMINANYPQIIFPVDTAQIITNVESFIFTYLYANHVYVDSILIADREATTLAGNTNSSTYTQALWNYTSGFTIPLFRHATFALASLIYTAYVESQNMAINEAEKGSLCLGQNYPNPVKDQTVIPFNLDRNYSKILLRIYDEFGDIRYEMSQANMMKGHHEVTWKTKDLNDGLYYCVLEAGNVRSTVKLMLVH